MPEISVIVPFLNAEADLPTLVDRLMAQSVPRSERELIFIDNGSTDGGPAYLNRFRSDMRCLFRTDRRGAYAARNFGLEVARAPTFALTDADCQPECHWLAEGLKALEGSPRAAGRIRLVPSEPATWAETLDASRFLRQKRYVAEGFGATANLFVRRTVFEQVGLFDESLISGGDYEFGQRARRMHYGIIYAEDAVVIHPCRRSLRALLKKAHRVGYGFGQSLRRNRPEWTRIARRVRDRVRLGTQKGEYETQTSHHLAVGHTLMGVSTLFGCMRGFWVERAGPIVPTLPKHSRRCDT